MARPPSPTLFPYTTLFRSAIEAAGNKIFSDAKADRSRRGMGTTATIAALIDDHLFFGQVGDSRAYLLRGDRLVQRSEEHTSELQSQFHLVCRLLLGKKKMKALDPHVDVLRHPEDLRVTGFLLGVRRDGQDRALRVLGGDGLRDLRRGRMRGQQVARV